MRNCREQATANAAPTEKSRITPFGRYLRKYKLDELPQILNVIGGEMSLVGPRPKVPEQQIATFSCRPGITGKATLVFAREERLFARVPDQFLSTYYRSEILPIKMQLDVAYMAQASVLSDINILFKTVTGQWSRLPILLESLEVSDERHIAHADVYSINP